MLCHIDIMRILHEVDTFTLALSLRLHNKRLSLSAMDGSLSIVSIELCFEIIKFHWKHVSLWEKVELLREAPIHSHKAIAELPLIADA